MKTCSKCRQGLPLSAFRPRGGNREGLYPYCKDCAVAYQAAYRADNAGVRAEWFAENKGRQRQNYNAWRLRNLGHLNAAKARRHAAKLRATPAWAKDGAIRAIYEAAQAMSVGTGVAHAVDHIVPLQGATVCGLHCEANLQVLTMHENASKRNRYWPDMPEPQQ